MKVRMRPFYVGVKLYFHEGQKKWGTSFELGDMYHIVGAVSLSTTIDKRLKDATETEVHVDDVS